MINSLFQEWDGQAAQFLIKCLSFDFTLWSAGVPNIMHRWRTQANPLNHWLTSRVTQDWSQCKENYKEGESVTSTNGLNFLLPIQPTKAKAAVEWIDHFLWHLVLFELCMLGTFFLDWHKICAKISFSLLLHELLRIDRIGPRDWWRWAGACRVQTRTPTGQLPTWSSLTAGYKRLSDIIWWALMMISTRGHGNQLDNLHLIQDDLRWHIRTSMTMTAFAFDFMRMYFPFIWLYSLTFRVLHWRISINSLSIWILHLNLKAAKKIWMRMKFPISNNKDLIIQKMRYTGTENSSKVIQEF